MAVVRSKVGSFVRNITTGHQSISGLGFAPDAVLLWTTWQTAGDTFEDGLRWSHGWITVDGVAAGNVTCGGEDRDNLSTSDVHQCVSNGAVLRQTTTALAVLEAADPVTLDSNGFTINWTVNSGTAAIVYYAALYGQTLSVKSANAVGAASGAPDGIKSVAGSNGTGFIPTGYVICQAYTASSGTVTDSGMNLPALGFTDGTTAACATVEHIHNVGTSNTFRYQRIDKVLASLWLGVLFWEADHVSMDADGFTVDYTTRANFIGRVFYYLAFGGVSCHVGVITQPTATGSQAITGLGLTPSLVMIQSVGRVASTSVEANARYTVGCGAVSGQYVLWFGSEDAVDPTRTARLCSSQYIIVLADPEATASGSTVGGRASLASIDADGFTLDWDVCDGTQRELIYFALDGGTPISAIPWDTSTADCCTTAPGSSSGIETDADNWTPACAGAGTVPTADTPAASETWNV